MEPMAPTGSVVERLTAPAGPSSRSLALVPSHRQRPMRQRLLHLALRAVQTPVSHGEPGGSGAPSSGCRAGRPHLEELGVGSGRIQGLKIPDGSRRELDVVALVKAHGRAATKGIERIDAVLAGHDQGAGGMGRCAGVGEEGEGEQAGPGGEPAGGAPPLATRAVGKRRARSGR